jgi:predicted Zn-dependent protease
MIGAGRLDEAESALRVQLARSPRHGEAWRWLARLEARRGNQRRCAEALHRVPAWWPGKREDQFLEGQAFLQAGRARDAERAWRGAVADDPLHPLSGPMVNGATQSLVGLLLLQERQAEAREVLWQAHPQVQPREQPTILGTMMRVEVERIDPAEAVATLSRYAAADPDDRATRLALARALQGAGDPRAADERATPLLGGADSADAWRVHLLNLLDRNQTETLAEAFRRAPAALLETTDPLYQTVAGVVAENAGDLDRARASFEAALGRDAFDPETHFRLARVLLRLGDAAGAAEHRERSRVLRDARKRIPDALVALRDAERRPADREARARVYRELEQISRTLGWTRLADEWARLLAPVA